MKKLKPVVFAILLGCICAFLLFKRMEKTNALELQGNAVAVQIGVFTKKENAEAMKKNYGGIVTEDEGVFRVYYAVLSKDKNVEFITNHLRNEGINYYLKRLTLNEELLDKIVEYEDLMENTNAKSKMTINEEVLKLYEEVI